MHWFGIKDGDPRGMDLYKRHYSRYQYKDGRKPKLFVGPGEKMVLLTTDGLALWAWRRCKFPLSGQEGVNNAIFRNEGPVKSSDLIREAVEIAQGHWPGERMFTFVNPKEIKSANPGYCFKVAGWKQCGLTKSGLIVLELLA